jgi:hypothetical protein
LRVVRIRDRQKSRQANGTALLPGVDGRSAWVRRCKELIADEICECRRRSDKVAMHQQVKWENIP